VLERPLDSKSEDGRNVLSSGRRLPTRQVNHTIQPLQLDCGGFFLGLKQWPVRFASITSRRKQTNWKSKFALKILFVKSREPQQFDQMPNIDTGQMGEQFAVSHLRERGYQILAVRERDASGEIDIIANDNNSETIVFVEVKTLRTAKPGHPAERVDYRKQQQITRAALRYLKRNQSLDTKSRFDVIAIRWPRNAKEPTEIRHFISAFEATDDYQFF